MSVYGKKSVYNASTGEATYVDLTPQEVARRDNERGLSIAEEIRRRVKQEKPAPVEAPPPAPVSLLASFYQDISANGAEATLYSYTLSGGALANDGDCLTARYSVEFDNSVSAKTLRFYWGTTLILDASLSTAAAGSAGDLDVMVIRTGPAALRISARLVVSGSSNEVRAVQDELTGVPLASPQLFRISGANGVTAKTAMITLYRR